MTIVKVKFKINATSTCKHDLHPFEMVGAVESSLQDNIQY